jgi:predicted nucleotidyltransferase component of viral defense system
MPVDEFHQALAVIVLQVASEYGFVVAGGNALIKHGIVDRYTADLDLFSNREGAVEAAAAAVETALRKAGMNAERQDTSSELSDIWEGLGEGMAEWLITAPTGGQTVLQMAYFIRSRTPVIIDAVPVLAIEDALGWKCNALVTRVEPRDYVDVAAALGRYSVTQLIGFARRLEPALRPEEFADAGRRLDEMADSRFARMRLSPAAIALIRKRFADWPRD